VELNVILLHGIFETGADFVSQNLRQLKQTIHGTIY